MSLYGALFSAVSGLNANSQALGAISDNISNVNTIGYKSNDTQFSTLVTEGRSSNFYSPGGVTAKVRQLVSRGGLLQASASNTDLAIDGAGFFVTRTLPDSLNGEVRFTRAGSFTQDARGFLKNTAGLYLMGWQLDSTGNYLNDGNLGSLTPVSTAGFTGTAEATTNVRVRANLQASQEASSAYATYNANSASFNMAGGNVQPDFIQSVQVFDTQGGTHNVNFAFIKTNVPNAWDVEIFSPDPADVQAIPGLQQGQLATGRVIFNQDGSLKLQPAFPGDTNITNLLGSPPLSSPITPQWTNGAGAEPIKLNLGSDGKLDGLTQYEARSQVISTDRNGAVFGNVIAVDISKDGIVTAQFSNGISRKVYKLPVATFQNPDELVRQQSNSYIASDRSGSYAINEPGLGGGGQISAATLEASTVDLASEFTKLITTQRAYSSSARIITTADQMLQELTQVGR
jgi:flagellar hook protein FlgE